MVLKEKVAIITGASGALGRETLRVFLAEGAKIAGCDVVEFEMTDLADAVAHGDCMIMRFDVTTERGATEMVAHTLNQFGRVDILVNVVGGWKGGVPLHRTSAEDWDGMFTLNLKSAFLCSRAVVPTMKRQGSGRIVNVISGAGKRGFPNLTGYCAAKFGVIGFSQALQLEVKDHGLSVTCVCPGPTLTRLGTSSNIYDPSIMLQPEDLAEAIVFVATQPQRVIVPEMEVRPRAYLS